MRRRWVRRARGDQGAAAAELIVMVMVYFGFFALVAFAGQMNVGTARVDAAARAAARQLSRARDPGAALGTARADAATIVHAGSPTCAVMEFSPTITAETVDVRVTCSVDLGAAAYLDVIPGSMMVTAHAVEVIDRHRETVG